eukprot:347241-Chlamydomonas_euryale.AAC.2
MMLWGRLLPLRSAHRLGGGARGAAETAAAAGGAAAAVSALATAAPTSHLRLKAPSASVSAAAPPRVACKYSSSAADAATAAAVAASPSGPSWSRSGAGDWASGSARFAAACSSERDPRCAAAYVAAAVSRQLGRRQPPSLCLLLAKGRGSWGIEVGNVAQVGTACRESRGCRGWAVSKETKLPDLSAFRGAEPT